MCARALTHNVLTCCWLIVCSAEARAQLAEREEAVASLAADKAAAQEAQAAADARAAQQVSAALPALLTARHGWRTQLDACLRRSKGRLSGFDPGC